MTTGFHLKTIDSSWQPVIQSGLKVIDTEYLQQLRQVDGWLPGPQKIFNAFSLPISEVKYVLFGESPYPRAQSANGYAFWDAAVTTIWSPTGLSKTVNRATSLRNIIKMLLIAEGLLNPKHTSQADIAALNKNQLVQTNNELFQNLIQHGVLLLNASLVLQPSNVRKDARAWRPFLKHIMDYLIQKNPKVEFILLGNIANEIDPLLSHPGIKKFYAEHPYNISFINNPKVLDFFRPLHLLQSQQ